MLLLGAKIRALRQQYGITQTTLAEALGITQAHLSAIERSARPRDVASLDVIVACAAFFSVTTDYLLHDRQIVGTAASSAVHAERLPPARGLHIGVKLRELRNQRALSLADAVDAIKSLDAKTTISRSHLGNLETGRKQPSIDLLLILADFYRVTTDYLLHDRLPS